MFKCSNKIVSSGPWIWLNHLQEADIESNSTGLTVCITALDWVHMFQTVRLWFFSDTFCQLQNYTSRWHQVTYWIILKWFVQKQIHYKCVLLRDSQWLILLWLCLGSFWLVKQKKKKKKPLVLKQTSISKLQKKKKRQIFNTFNQSQLSCHYHGVAMGADMHAEQKIMSTSSIIHIPFEKSVCERNIKCCNYIKADRKRRQTNKKSNEISFQDSFGSVTYYVLQEFEPNVSKEELIHYYGLGTCQPMRCKQTKKKSHKSNIWVCSGRCQPEAVLPGNYYRPKQCCLATVTNPNWADSTSEIPLEQPSVGW